MEAKTKPMAKTMRKPSSTSPPAKTRQARSSRPVPRAKRADPASLELQTKLIAAAAQARRRAVAHYSRFRVGAALLTATGEIIAGANVESASYSLTCCAERVALFHALTSGHRRFVAVAVVADAPGGPTPCGACRQLLAEYAPDAAVWVADSRALKIVRAFTVRDLMPAAFVEVPQYSD
jgi:cytidine deaminase